MATSRWCGSARVISATSARRSRESRPRGRELVVAERLVLEAVPPAPQHLGEPLAPDRIHLRRHPARGRLDRRVGEDGLERGRDRVPRRAAQLDQEPAVDLTRVPVEAVVLGVGGLEGDERLVVEPGQVEREPVELHERLVVVARDGLPEGRVALLERGPAPLVPVPVAVAHEDVHEPSPEKRARVHPVVRTGVDPTKESGRRDHLARPTGGIVRVRGGPLLDQTEHALEIGPVLAEGGIVGHEGEGLRIGEHAGRFQETIGDERRRGERRAYAVLQRLGVGGAAELGDERRRRILVHVAELVLAPIRPGESERLGLAPRVGRHRGQSAGELSIFRTGTRIGVVRDPGSAGRRM